jgi:hypothetical protein
MNGLVSDSGYQQESGFLKAWYLQRKPVAGCWVLICAAACSAELSLLFVETHDGQMVCSGY